MPKSLDDLLQDLAIANRILVNEGVLDGFGHISLRHPERADRFSLPAAWHRRWCRPTTSWPATWTAT